MVFSGFLLAQARVSETERRHENGKSMNCLALCPIALYPSMMNRFLWDSCFGFSLMIMTRSHNRNKAHRGMRPDKGHQNPIGGYE